jgi:hypothetical protein
LAVCVDDVNGYGGRAKLRYGAAISNISHGGGCNYLGVLVSYGSLERRHSVA